ncbi:MAG: DNA cytosine methyltransferase [Eubacteriales bacterium]|nr:DNA cytosine methyltransferase [Eubacteriales bacterium]
MNEETIIGIIYSCYHKLFLKGVELLTDIYTAVSLFSGAGGMDMGFERQGFRVVWANDIDRDSCETHRKWSNAEIVQGDISKVDLSSIPKSDIILGGFPCQGFSLAGPRKIDDKRNSLYRHFVKLVGRKQPLAFVAENVKGILTLGDGAILEAIVEDFSGKGYTVTPYLVNASDYGVPQDRYRVILIGLNKEKGLKFELPKPFDYKITITEALKDLHEPKKEDVCQATYSSRYMSRNRRKEWNEVSYTIPAMAKQVPLHPSSPKMVKIDTDLWEFGDDGITRRFSWQEAAAIQTFPKGTEFVGNITSKYKQIGNAVPVKLAEAIAKALHECLSGVRNEIWEYNQRMERHLNIRA